MLCAYLCTMEVISWMVICFCSFTHVCCDLPHTDLRGPPHLDSYFSFGGFGGSVPCFRAWEFGWKFKGLLTCFECNITHIVIVLNQPQMGNKSFLDRSSIPNIKWLLGFQKPEAKVSQSQDTCAKEKVLTRSPALAGLFKDVSIHWPESQF